MRSTGKVVWPIWMTETSGFRAIRNRWRRPALSGMMGVLEGLFSPYLTTDNLTALGRMGLATVLGMLLGIDREVRRKPAGLRSHMLVSLAVALLTILTFRIADAADQLGDAVRADPLRTMGHGK